MIDYNERDPWPMPPARKEWDILKPETQGHVSEQERQILDEFQEIIYGPNAKPIGLAKYVAENIPPAREMKDSLWLKLWDMPGNAWDWLKAWFK